ncbi:hypothetical protein HDU79_011467 [Rhizoclosmatium sp. JEL0117]|nr:hypothetical protein HDU79_011467 [Rhizoclosmatium sp. JEL0117]
MSQIESSPLRLQLHLSPFDCTPDEVIIPIFAWIHPTQVFRYRRLCKRINDLLLTKHFATLNLTRIPALNTHGNSSLDVENAFFNAPPSFQSACADKLLNGQSEVVSYGCYMKEAMHYKIPAAFWELKTVESLKLKMFLGPLEISTGVGGKMIALTKLTLKECDKLGPIPSALWELVGLTELTLEECGLTGALDSAIGNLMRLRCLNVAENNLEGSIPSELGLLTDLEELDLGSNLFSGVIPASVGNFINLTSLSLEYNRLSGSIPAELSNLVRLSKLYLSENKLKGEVPLEFQHLVNLEVINLSGNPGLCCAFQFPDMHFAVLSLTNTSPFDSNGNISLDVEKAFFSAPASYQSVYTEKCISDQTEIFWFGYEKRIPSTLWEMKSKTVESIKLKTFLGPLEIPPGTGARLSGLKQLYLNLCQELGLIPEGVWEMVGLTELTLGHCGLIGKVGSAIGNLVNLIVLDLGANFLEGPIPAEIGLMSGLKELSLSCNRFSGTIPETLGTLVKLEYLSLGYNLLCGPIPSELSNLVNLKKCYLTENDLAGFVPREFLQLVNLEIINLSGNANLICDFQFPERVHVFLPCES